MAKHSDISLDPEALALQQRRGCDVSKVVSAMGKAKRDGFKLSLNEAAQMDLDGQDPVDVVNGWIREKRAAEERELLAKIPGMFEPSENASQEIQL